jgi:hypothetical protein
MPYVIEAQATRGYLCQARSRVKRDAFEIARMCACLLHFPDSDRERLTEAQLGPAMPSMSITTPNGKVSVRRVP